MLGRRGDIESNRIVSYRIVCMQSREELSESSRVESRCDKRGKLIEIYSGDVYGDKSSQVPKRMEVIKSPCAIVDPCFEF